MGVQLWKSNGPVPIGSRDPPSSVRVVGETTKPIWAVRAAGKATHGLFMVTTATRSLVGSTVTSSMGVTAVPVRIEALWPSRVAFTASAVRAEPSWKVTPSRRVMVHSS